MSSAAVDLAQYLVDQGLGTAGVDVFDGPLAEQPNNGIGVTHYTGEPAEYVMGPSLSASSKEVAIVQVLVRNLDQAAARAKAAAAHAALENLGPVTLPGGRRYFHVASVSGEPHQIPGRDQNGRFRFECDYRVEKSKG